MRILFCNKRLPKYIAFLAAAAIMCCAGCSSNNANSAAADTATQQQSQAVQATEPETNSLPYAPVKSIDKLDLSRIDHVGAYVLDNKVYSTTCAKDLCAIIKTLKVNSDTQPPKAQDGSDLMGYTELFACNGEKEIYDLSLLGTTDNFKVYVSDGKSYFYCDITNENAAAFTDIYSTVYEQHTKTEAES